jgi:hypothetical protein
MARLASPTPSAACSKLLSLSTLLSYSSPAPRFPLSALTCRRSETRHNTYGAEPLGQALGDGSGKVVEPHTGLPMNVGRYGDGAGGTDGSATVHGVHQHGVGEGKVDWEGVRKADTPY